MRLVRVLCASTLAFMIVVSHSPVALGDRGSSPGSLGWSQSQDPAASGAFDAAIRDGTSLLRAGEAGRALVFFRRALELIPDAPVALAYLGVALLQLGRTDEALAPLERAASRAPNLFVAQYFFGSALMRLERYEEALGPLAAAVRLQPDNADAWYRQAAVLSRLGRHEGARQILERGLVADPGSADAWILLARSLERHDGSLDALVRATEAYENALALRPGASGVAVPLARVYRRLGLYEEAITFLDDLVATRPGDANLQLARGRALLDLRRYEEAKEGLQRAIDAGAGAAAHFELGVAARNLADFGGALAAFRTATEIRPDYAAAHLELGNLHRIRQEFDAARESLQRAVQEAPENPEAHNQLGLAVLQGGDAGAALPHFERALELAPDLANAAYNRSLALRDLGRVEDSRAAMEEFQALDRAQETALVDDRRATEIAVINSHGLYYYRRGSHDHALERFERALELSPDDPLIHFNIGLAHAALEDHENAVAAFERALDLDPDRPDPYVALARAYRALGRLEDAARMEDEYRRLRGEQ